MTMEKCFSLASMQIILFIYIFNLILSFQESLCKTCTNQSFSSKILPCDGKNSTELIFYSTEVCDITEDNLNLYHSKISDLSCDLTCPKGYILDYNFSNSSLSCKSCPENTYSDGGNFSINGTMKEWTQDIFSKYNFVSTCDVLDSLGKPIKNKKCNPFTISNDHSMITSGTTDDSGYTYKGRLFFGVFLKNEGEIKIRYKKVTKTSGGYENGEFIMYIDYNLEIMERDSDTTWKIFKRKLEPGYHDFLLGFHYFSNKEDQDTMKNIKLFINAIEISGVENASTECKPCVDSISGEGSSFCLSCQESYYYNKIFKTCVECPERRFSLANSVGVESCIEMRPCTMYDYELISSKCESRQNDKNYALSRILSYRLISPIICDINHPNSLKNVPEEIEECGKCEDGLFLNSDYECVPCPKGSYSNASTFFKCIQCKDGTFAKSVYELNKFYGIKDNEFENNCIAYENQIDCINKKWIFMKDKITVSTFPILSNSVDLVLKKSIYIDEKEGIVHFDYLINNSLVNGGNFEFLINNEVYLSTTSSQNAKDSRKKSFQSSLSKGKYTLTWKVSFNKKELESHSSVNTQDKKFMEITSIKIYGSNIGWSSHCENCPQGTIRSNEKDKFDSIPNYQCKLCQPGTTSDETNHNCLKCPKDQFSSEERICNPCPTFTLMNNKTNTCEPIDIIQNKNKLLRFNMNKLKSDFKNKCEGLDDGFTGYCYSKKFLGPIEDNIVTFELGSNRISRRNLNDNYLFFISPYEIDRISLDDYSYEKEKNDVVTGHIFSLIELESFKFYNFTNEISSISHPTQMANLKELKNLGSYIKKISVIDDVKLSNAYNQVVNNGIIIEYAGGDICLKDPSIS